MPRLLDAEEITRALASLPGWSGDVVALARSYEFPGFTSAIEGVSRIGAVAEEMDHHPDIDVRWRTLVLRLSTHSAGGVTQLDVELAHRIAEIAGELGAT